jgi:hypothetical protein
LAEDLLQRLVCFVASALDVRYAFVTELRVAQAADAKASVAVWLARDYGLQFEHRELDDREGLLDGPWPYPEVLRKLWPEVPELAALKRECWRGLPLYDSSGQLLGHLAALNPGSARRISETERLQSLVGVAAAELARRRMLAHP